MSRVAHDFFSGTPLQLRQLGGGVSASALSR
jgi:hypothetical protein